MGDGRSMGGRRGNGGRGEIGGNKQHCSICHHYKDYKTKETKKKGAAAGNPRYRRWEVCTLCVPP